MFSAVVATFVYGVMRFVQHRRWYKDLPKPPHSFFWGHLKLMGETLALYPGSVHFQYTITTMAQKYKLPRLFYLDLWPVGPIQLIVTDPDLALHMTVANNYPKHPMEAVMVDPIVGEGNIVAVEGGPRWKYLHNMLAPAFSVSQVRDMLPMIAEEIMTFRSILNEKAQSGKSFSLEAITKRLTFDIIGTATFGQSLKAQAKGSPVLDTFDRVCRAFAIERDHPWNMVKVIPARRRRSVATGELNAIVDKLIRERFEILMRDNLDVSKKRGLSIVDLVLRDRYQEVQRSGVGAAKALDQEFMHAAITQIKTLLLAGSGTTTDTLCFTYMFLSVHQDIVEKLREEHNRVFCPGVDASYRMLQDNPSKINDLPYTTNVIKETLRFYPVGNTARAPPAPGGFITYEGRQYPTTGHMVCPVQHTMHLDPEIFPNPQKYDPDRYDRDESPRHAWRPFERGPRACLGQVLAMDEMKAVLLLTVRDFDFKCADLKPNKTPRVEWTNLDLTFGDRAFQDFVFEACPRDGMPMMVTKTSAAPT
ncbi:cytochrome P450 [Polyplosphaeria fusca]|uniref:Cytochrome P450 n=1 Tax=Polyplosphaeria fusca TaxID=682080 RepID=A0A9P4UZH3_9PLEO|nr:cytochrome P450 [Polyplosphaeria fusca]